MAWAVAGRRDQGDLFAQSGIAGDEFGLAGVRDRLHGVVETPRLCRAPCCGRASAHIRFCRTHSAHWRRSAPIGRRRVLCSSRHGRHADGCTARCRCCRAESRPPSAFRERAFAVVPGWHIAAFLVVAKPGVDHDPARGRLDHQRMDRHLEHGPPRSRNAGMSQGNWRISSLPADGRMNRVLPVVSELDDFCDFDLAHLPVHSTLPSSLACVFVSCGERC